MKLDPQDLRFSVMRLPSNLKKLMMDKEWSNSVFVGGGYIRSIVANETINDIDVFVKSQKDAELLAFKLAYDKKDVCRTNNAYTIKGKTPIQIIHRWVFEKPEDVGNSFDFTICCAVIFFEGDKFDSYCDDRFYIDMAGKRIMYRSPVRNEDAGGSMLRVLKYYQKGYRIPLFSLGKVIARLISGMDTERLDIKDQNRVAHILTGLLREVDPDIDPLHAAHLPNEIDV
jgi:hypothetical protein